MSHVGQVHWRFVSPRSQLEIPFQVNASGRPYIPIKGLGSRHVCGAARTALETPWDQRAPGADPQ